MMKKENSFGRKIQNLWKQKPTVVSMNDKRDEYAVKQDKRADIVIRIFSVLAAVLIWIYAVSTGDSVHTANLEYTTAHLQIRNEAVLDESGLDYAIDDMMITVSVQGRRLRISGLEPGDVTIYLDFSEIRYSGKQAVKIGAEVPQGFAVTSISPEYVWVDFSTVS
ncbi:MAG: hypothetical protein KBS76_07960 [Ruminococcus sp.]|nr:hypothetical protein [Candidatus Apopatosoma intestinale]